MKASCGCSELIHDVGNKKIIAKYTAKPIPPHLITENIFEVTKKITLTIEYRDMEDIKNTQYLEFWSLVKQD